MTKKQMIGFLSHHFRYDTAGGWNRSTSYAVNLKIHKVIPREFQNRAYELIGQAGIYKAIDELINDFNVAHDWQYQAGFNGRSGGYLVLYQGGKRASEHKSYCTNCGQRNFNSIAESGTDECGACSEHTRIDYEVQPVQPFTYSGKSIDADEDFSGWCIDELRARVKLVKEFDRLAASIVALTIKWCKKYKVEERDIQVTKTIKVLV